MLIAILLLTIFNAGLLILTVGAIAILTDEHRKGVVAIKKTVDEDAEILGEAMFNMESIKQKIEMTGRFEL